MMKMIKKLVVLTKEVELPTEITEDEVQDRTNLISLLRDLRPDLTAEIESVEWDVRIEGATAIVARTGATFG